MTTSSAEISAERRSQLLGLELAAIVRDRTPGSNPVPGVFPPGAAVIDRRRAWVLLATGASAHRPDPGIDDGTGLGAAILWAMRNGAVEIDVVADVPLTTAARRAAEFSMPVRVWTLDGRDLLPVNPGPTTLPPVPKPEHLSFAGAIEAAGAAVVVEHGVVTGEVRGLEVCRVVEVDDGDRRGIRLEVGVGPQDRDAFAVIHGDVPAAEALADVVSRVAAARSPDAPGHPLNRLAPERWLRWRLEQEPRLVGMATVEPAQPPVPRPGLKQRTPCTALGRRPDGTPVVVVCSVGVDLDVVPYAADARLAAIAAVGAARAPVETLIVMPERDLLPATRQAAALLRRPVSVMPLRD